MSFLKWILTPGGRKCSERVRAFNSVTQHHSHETTRHIMIISLFLVPRFHHSTGSNQSASCLELTAVGNDDLGTSLARLGAVGLDSLNNILALLNGAEHTMLAVQPGGGDCAEEELGTVGVRTSVGHGEDSGASVLEGEVLVLKLVAVDRLASGAVVVGDGICAGDEAWPECAYDSGNDADGDGVCACT